jgi:hypothetical protein
MWRDPAWVKLKSDCHVKELMGKVLHIDTRGNFSQIDVA